MVEEGAGRLRNLTPFFLDYYILIVYIDDHDEPGVQRLAHTQGFKSREAGQGVRGAEHDGVPVGVGDHSYTGLASPGSGGPGT